MRLFLYLLVFAGSLFAQTPTITAVLNNYSRSWEIASGSIFIIQGTNLSDRSTGLQATPLPAALEGVRVTFSPGPGSGFTGLTVDAPLYYVTPTQIAGIVPSSVPGSVIIRVNNNGRLSPLKSYALSASSFGTLAFDVETGMGKAIAQHLNYTLLGDASAANPGEVIILYGSGLGAVRSGVDETALQTGVNASGDMTEIPIQVTIGGKQAEILYRGRSIFPGLDQINLRVPVLDANAYGCDVPLLVTIGTSISNGTTIPVAPSGAVCQTQSIPASPRVDIQPTPQEIEAWSAQGSYVSGEIRINKNTNPHPPNATPLDLIGEEGISATFYRRSGEGLFRLLRGERPAGSPDPLPGQCEAFSSNLTSFGPSFAGFVDAGTSFNVFGPAGVRVVPYLPYGYFAAVARGDAPKPGLYNIVGPGGADVGPFSGTVTVAPDLVVTSPATNLAFLDRAQPLTLRWTGGEPDGTVSILFYSTGGIGASTWIACRAEFARGEITVPANLLSQLSPGPGGIGVSAQGKGNRLPSPTGVDILTVINYWRWGAYPVFQ